MNVTSISSAEERALELHERASRWRGAGLLTDDELSAIPKPERRTSRLWTRIAFFVLACLATSMFYGLLVLMQLPKGIVTGAFAVGFAEFLLLRKRFLRTGIEEGFYIAGLCAVIVGLPGESRPEVILLFVLAFLLAGIRLANALFIAGAAMLVVVYAGAKSEDSFSTGTIAFVLFLAGAFLNQRRMARPFVSSGVAILTALLLPLAAILWSYAFSPSKAPLSLIAAIFATAVTAGAIAIRRRDRALLIGSTLTLIVSLVLAGNHVDAPWEWKLLAGSAASLAVVLVIDRRLAGRRFGITSEKLSDIAHADLIEMAGAVAVAPQTDRDPQPQRASGGGAFGGAGATGEF